MYHFFKKIINAILPKSLLAKHELALRSIYGFFHRGNAQQCTICNHKLSAFIALKNGDTLCPYCGSLARNRRLWILLNNNSELKGHVLHFSPSRCIYRELKKQNNITYYSTDYENEFLSDYKFDITAIDQPENKFQLIICYHILEHIEDDHKAMSELYRVLDDTGIVYIQTPFKEGDIYENKHIKTKAERLRHFGQEDHVRIYAIDGLKKRLETVGFKVNVMTYTDADTNFYNGLNPDETILKLTK